MTVMCTFIKEVHICYPETTAGWERYFPAIIPYPIFCFCVFREIRKKIEKGQWKTGLDETCLIDGIEFENMIKEMKQEYGSGFSKNYREMPEGEFVKSVLDEMKLWMFIRKEELAHQIKICPLTGKIQGSYPEDYMGGRNDE